LASRPAKLVANSPGREQSYIVCATPRSGSTLLCRLLAATGVAGRPESYFRLPDEASYAARWGVRLELERPIDYREYVRAAIRAGSSANGVFAARVMWGTMEEIVAKLRVFYGTPASTDLEVIEQELGRTCFLHLHRNDVVAQAVSWAKAEQAHYWQDGDKAVTGQRAQFSFDEVDRYVKTVIDHNAAWQAWFKASAVTPLVVTYEQLSADMAGTLGLIMQFLDLELPDDHTVEAPTRRQADEVNRDWASRYRAMRVAAGRWP
jgi:trehalose 2-sulfotransferase